jgi:hypothetical protein
VDDFTDSESEIEYISCIQSVNKVDSEMPKSDNEIFAEMKINRYRVKFQVDCGAAVNVLPQKYLGKSNELSKCTKILQMWNGSKIVPVGKCRLHVLNVKNNKKYSVEFIVVEDDLMPLLGAKASLQMNLITVKADNFKCINACTALSDPIVSAGIP